VVASTGSNQSNADVSFTLTTTPLPVELVSFTATRRGSDAVLRWVTAQERNNARFHIEASADGRRFQPVGSVAGAGTSTQRRDYLFVDANLPRYAAPLLYFRLLQIDYDGRETYSDVRTVVVEPSADLRVSTFPNPFQNAPTLRVQLPQAATASLLLQDALGRPLLTRSLELPTGATELPLPELARQPAGVYFLTVQTPTEQRVLKLVRQ
jgi:hypothetical protein